MSGFEIVGVILGLVPVVTGSIEHCRSLNDMRDLRQLERSFKTQRNIFENTIEELLSPLLSDVQLARLLEDPNNASWQDTTLSAKLEEHLGGDYQTFKEIVEDVKLMMGALQNILKPKDDGSTVVLKQVKNFVSRSRGEAGLKRLSMRIQDLDILKGQNQRLALRRKTKGLKPETYVKVRQCALSLYTALSRGWQCDCETPHHANLRLEARKPSQPKARRGSAEEDVRFRFLFSFTADQNKGGAVGQPLDWHEAELAPLEPPTSSSSTVYGIANNQVASTARETPSRYVEDTGATLGLPQSQQTASPHVGYDGRAIRFDLRPSRPLATNSQETSTTAANHDASEIKNLCQWIQNVHTSQHQGEGYLGYLAGADKTRYGLYRVNRRNDVGPPVASFHVGEALTPSRGRSRQRSRLKRQLFLLSTRYELAFTLGTTMLQLHSTPWLDNWTKQDILYLPDPEGEKVPPPVQPYISRRFSTSKSADVATVASPTGAIPQSFAPNKTLFTLGVVLIEIAFNKPIEELAAELGEAGDWASFVTAIRLHEQIQGLMGVRYQRAVKGCLSCDFGLNAFEADLNSVAFRQKFLENVIVPLEESMDFFVLK